MTGSIIGNILLVLGASFLAGGLRYKIQGYNAITARAQAQMLLLTSVAIIILALFHFLRPPEVVVNEAAISLALASLLMIVYVFSLIFSLHTHKELFQGAPQEGSVGEKGHATWNLPVAGKMASNPPAHPRTKKPQDDRMTYFNADWISKN